ncbi:hypothetical protein SS1G_08255 [Sclerotinia sclerotiorum 1980 UF-70]|uniref:Major facilitator superfamily (MFS) profile domain-containing protein n=1 Tax=Sclerotinia sclerotiorum (strain ATCC 18683 / 1980 / Ss-1) TaxID=665079 RepID=A7ESF0_SCLS1|nr:hypothetical protein SS1G_08255 [Sclerotinia sclerotiorum 1980 UF-70]EDN92392.1 hypothetical protein SS1G_08255 [Sclerotinia sclerotiorum 1980 UF-70]
MVFGLGAASGAALGDVIADYLGWRWKFDVQVPGLIFWLIVSCLGFPFDLGLKRGMKSLREALGVFDYKEGVVVTYDYC